LIKAEFSASLLHSLVSHDPSEIIMMILYTVIINVGHSCAAQYFFVTCGTLFRIHWWK